MLCINNKKKNVSEVVSGAEKVKNGEAVPRRHAHTLAGGKEERRGERDREREGGADTGGGVFCGLC